MGALRGWVSDNSTFFFKELTPVHGPMSFAAKGKKIYVKSRQTNTSHCPTKTISKTDMHPLKSELSQENELSTLKMSEASPIHSGSR